MKSNPKFLLAFLVFFITGIFNLSAQKSKAPAVYHNPVLAGDYPDPSVCRDGKDYYLTNSSFEYYPGLLIWHSTDLIHWERVCHALHQYVGSVYAPDLIKHNGMWYIYFPAGGTNWVVTAKTPEGPWSPPVDLKLRGFIDPGHVVGPDGKRYLYLSKGCIVQLTDDGQAIVGEAKDNLGKQGFLRILNDRNEVSFYYSADKKGWTRLERSLDITGYNHNVFGQFLSLRAGLYAFGKGIVKFDNFIYKVL